MSQEKNWVQQPKQEGGGEDGDYNPTWEPQKIPIIEGTLTGSRPNVGKYNKTVYDLKVEDGTTYSVWGTTVLEKQMVDIPINSYIKIEYLGKKQGKGNSYHDYNVFVAGEQAPQPTAEAAPAPAPEAAAAPAPTTEQPADEVKPPPAPAADESGEVPF